MTKTSNCPFVQYTEDRSEVALTTNNRIKAKPPLFILAILNMARNMRLISSLLLLLTFIFVPHANAYQLEGYKWPQPTTTFYVDIPDAEGLWNNAFETAMYSWGVDTIFEYKIVRGVYEDPCDPYDGRNGVGFEFTICGDAWGGTTLAIAQSWTIGSTLSQSDIVFNNNESWNVYSTSWSSWPWPGVNDFQRVAVHELGHALGLDHEDSGVTTIMRTYAGDITIPQQDDINGVAAIYGSSNTCTYNISPTSSLFSSSGNTGTVAVTASTSACSWTAASDASWITITSGSSDTGNGTVSYDISANTSASSRSGTMTIAGQTFTVNQSGVICSYSISSSSANRGSWAGSGSFSVTTPGGCSWSASTSYGWIHTSSSGNGNGTVNYTVDANTGTSARSGTITVQGQTFTVNQSGVSCTFSISLTSALFSSASNSGTVAVTASTSACFWTAASDASWITITSGSSDTGNGTVSYDVSVNTGTSSRSGTMTIAGQTFTVNQSGVICSYSISSSSYSFTYSGGTGSVGLTATSTCSWIAESNASWIAITSGGSGSGNGTVGYSVAANRGLTRTETMTIGGQAFTITQASANAYLDTVQKIYIGYYQRPSDPAGLIYWAGRLDSSGGNLTEIIEAFANSAESQALYGTINSSNISTVVNGIYYALFGRDAEAGGLNYYVNGFSLDLFTPATIMLNVLYGAQNEDLQSVNNKTTAANLFTMTIDPDLDGSNFQVTYAGEPDAIAGRNFLTLYASSVKVPTQAETTAYIKANIANPGDGILTQ